jgi:[ribosomal protein S18]-alanine N-acetyltransferase
MKERETGSLGGLEGGEEFEIVPMQEPDLEQVLLIEVSSFSSPWTEDMFRHEFERSRVSWCFVAKAGGGNKDRAGTGRNVLGYICLWIIGDEMQIANVAVHPSWRRKGVGKTLLGHALQFGRSHGARVAVLEVRVSNGGAQRLYRSFGFGVAGMRRGYYQFPPEDAIVMILSLVRGSSWPKIS